MPTLYPKCAPSEMLGFLLLLSSHNGSQEIARVAEEESLAMDKLLPAIEYAEGLGLVTISDGRATLTDSGRMLMAADIRVRKDLLRELLRRTILFRAIARSLDQSVDKRVAEDELQQIVAFTNAPPEAIHEIITWGRYAGLFRYDVDQHALLPAGAGRRTPAASPVIALPSSQPPLASLTAPAASNKGRTPPSPRTGAPPTVKAPGAVSATAPRAVPAKAGPSKTGASSPSGGQAPSTGPGSAKKLEDAPKKKGPVAP